MKRLSTLLSLLLFTGVLYAQGVLPTTWTKPANTFKWFKSTGERVRGMAYNASNNHLYVATRDTLGASLTGGIIILDGTTGDSIGALNMTGIAGGTFAFNRLGIASDGRIYTTNLQTAVTKAASLKIYTWADESAAPVLVFNDSIQGPRLGDALAVSGSGQETYVYVSGNAAPGPVNVFKRSGDTLVVYKTIVPAGWAGGVLSIGTTATGFGNFWINVNAKAAQKYDTSGAVLDTVPGIVASTAGSGANYFEFAGKKYLAIYSGSATLANPSIVRFVDITDGGSKGVVVTVTPSMGTNANTNAPLGEVVYSANDSSVYVLSANNNVGKYSVKLAPPSVAVTQRIPLVPQANENDTVYFNINSMKPVSNSKLTYFGFKTSVSDQNGVDSADVTLSLVSGSQYKAVVPGSVNRDGRRILFRAEVTDVVGVKATVSVPGYFAGMTKLSYLGGPREVDTNGVILHKGYGIRSQGVVIVEDSVFQVANSEIVLQDSLGGVTVFKAGTPFDVKRGNVYIITGTTDNPTGGGSKFQFVDPGITFTDLGPAPFPVKPRLITIKQLLANGEPWENTLVEIRGVSKAFSSPAWPTAGASVNMIFKDASGDSTTMRIDGDTNIDGIPEPTYPITIVGVQGQFDNTAPFTSGYQWLPRDTTDIRPFKLRPPIPPFVLNNANITFGASLDTAQAGSGGRKGVGTGAVVLSEDRQELMYQVTVSGLSGTITQAHFHNGAPGVAGGVVKNITFNGKTAYGYWRASDATQPLTPQLLAELLTGRLYFNVHTSTFGGGEIRGQIYPGSGIAFAAIIDSTLAKTSSTANGTAAVFLTADRSTIKYSVTYDGLEGNLTASHFHNAPADSSGGVVKNITLANGTAIGEWKKTDGVQPLTDQLIAELMRGRLYINIHSSQSPGGEIRGQVRLVGGYGFGAMLDSAQAGTNKPGRGTGLFHLSGQDVNTLNYRITVSGLSGDITGAHIHLGAKGVPGPVVKPLNFFGNTAHGSWSATDSTNKFTDSLFSALIRGRLYVNIHTAAHPGGEIRGQIELTTGFGIAVGLDNAQAGKTGNGRGTGWVTLSPNQDELSYNVTVNDLTGAITNSHFHSAQRGISGGVVKNMTFSNGNSTGSWKASDATQPLTSAMVDSLFNEALYVNIHTALNSGGEIRGQLSPGQGSLSSVKRISDIVPSEFALEQNYPNPFNPTTTIRFALPKDASVSLKIYDVLGREVRTLINSDVAAGTNTIEWNGKNNTGAQVASGMYIYRIEARQQDGGQAGTFISTKKMLMLK